MHLDSALRVITFASGALGCCALASDTATTPNVAYTASGTFATPPIRGLDQLRLAGQPFSITILASEALKPTRHSQTYAQYDNVPLAGYINSAFTYGSPDTITANSSIFLQVGSSGSPDVFRISFPISIAGYQLQVTADVSMPAGTITTPAIQPFTARVTLTSSNATARYADTSESTKLGLIGTLNADAQAPPPGITVLHNFTGSLTSGSDGGGPAAGLVEGNGGVFYGTTAYGGAGYGTVFELSPPAAAGGPWTETVLYSFAGGSDGAYPTTSVVIAADGSLYGATSAGGDYCTMFSFGCGTVFSLTPPSSPSGAWTETVLYRFTGGADGAQPQALVSYGGALYGTASYAIACGCGTVFELAPPAASGGAWVFTVLHSFTGGNGDGAEPFAGLTLGPGGVLYGTTADGGTLGYGTVFQMTPPAAPGGSWTEMVLYSFGAPPDGSLPEAPLALGAHGELYGTTYGGGSTLCYRGCGTVFKLTPNSGTWTESLLYTFQDTVSDGYYPTGGVVIGKGGTLYGAVSGGVSGAGSVFKLTTPASGGVPWNISLLTSFNVFDGDLSYGGLIIGSNGELYGTTQTGGTPACAVPITGFDIPSGCGTVFQLKP